MVLSAPSFLFDLGRDGFLLNNSLWYSGFMPFSILLNLHQQTKVKMHQNSLTQHKFTEALLFPVRATPNLTVCLKGVSAGRKHVQFQSVSTESTSDTTAIILTSSVYKLTIRFSLYKCVKLASLKYKKVSSPSTFVFLLVRAKVMVF